MEKASRIASPYSNLSSPDFFRWYSRSACILEGRKRIGTYPDNWQESVTDLFGSLQEEIVSKIQEAFFIDSLQRDITLLKYRCDLLERLSPILVPIESMAPEPFNVIKPFHAVVRFQDDQYISSFFDANLTASGDTQAEAISNLKDIITATFEMLASMDDDILGPGPLKQKSVLCEFISMKD